jgi:hypothetical protein
VEKKFAAVASAIPEQFARMNTSSTGVPRSWRDHSGQWNAIRLR